MHSSGSHCSFKCSFDVGVREPAQCICETENEWSALCYIRAGPRRLAGDLVYYCWDSKQNEDWSASVSYLIFNVQTTVKALPGRKMSQQITSNSRNHTSRHDTLCWKRIGKNEGELAGKGEIINYSWQQTKCVNVYSDCSRLRKHLIALNSRQGKPWFLRPRTPPQVESYRRRFSCLKNLKQNWLQTLR